MGSVFLFLGFLENEGGFVFVLSFGVSVNLSDFCLSDFILFFIFYLYFNFDYFVCVVVFVLFLSANQKYNSKTMVYRA